jgi:CheY-like chemotaxis protein
MTTTFASRGGLHGHRILVVDDNRDAADSLGIMLRYAGAVVHVAYDGFEALDAMPVYRPEIVLLDIGMPQLNGCEVARQIRSTPEWKDVILVALTGWGQPADRLRSDEAGINHHLVKPVDFDILRDLLLSLPANADG